MQDTALAERPDVPSGTVTFLFTDIEGSTKLLEQLRECYAALLAEHRDLLRAAFTHCHGHEIDTQGDAFFVAFPRASDAVHCAVEAQRALAGHVWPQGVPVRVRMGLHTGEPLVARTGYVGLDVHRAARIAAAGHGGQVLLSQTTHDLVCQDLPPETTLRALGDYKLKDIRFAQPLYQLDIAGLPSDFGPLRLLHNGAEPPTPGDPPFKGLPYFDEADAGWYFGRDEVIARLAARLEAERFLAVIGASGSGKSSLVRAGLVPALKHGRRLAEWVAAPGPAVTWHTLVITPSAHPLETLAISLTRTDNSPAAGARLMDDLRAEPRSLHLHVQERLHRDERGGRAAGQERVLLIVDQFEELFTLCRDGAERQAFVNNLLTAATTPDGGASVLLTLRADFYAHLADYPGLSAAVAQHQEYLTAMTAGELRQAIEGPAARGGWEFSPGLVDLLLHEIGASDGHTPEPGALPLLSHALLETWNHRRGNLLNLRAYSESGGVRGAIAHTAEGVFQHELTSGQQAIAREIFLRLTELGDGTQDTRRRVSYRELLPEAHGAEVEAVLARLADARLITTSADSVEVAHEALIREWPTLRHWLDEDREGLRLLRRLTEAAQAWARFNRDPSELYRGTRLAQARDWVAAHPGHLNWLEQAFLDASQAQAEHDRAAQEAARQRELAAAQQLAAAERQRAETQARATAQLRRRALYLLGAVVIAVAAALAALYFGRQANVNLTEARAAQSAAQLEAQARATQQSVAEANFTRAEAQRLAAESNKLFLSGGASELVALVALRALALEYSPQGDAALVTAAGLDYPVRTYPVYAGPVWIIAFAPDSRTFFTISGDGLIRVWDVNSTHLLQTINPGNDFLAEYGFTPTSQGLFIVTADERAHLWDIPTGRPTQEFALPGCGAEMRPTWLSASEILIGCDDHTIQRWDVDTGQKLDEWVFEDERPLPLHDGVRALSYSAAENAHRLWDIRTGAKLQTFAHDRPPVLGDWPPVAISLDDRLVAFLYADNSLSVWDTASGQRLQTIASTNPWNMVAISPDDRYLVTPGAAGDVRLWDIATGQEVRRFPGQTRQVYSAAFSPDGRYLLTTGLDGTAMLWNVEPQPEYPTLVGHQAAVSALDRSSDGRFLATAGWDDTLRVWDASTGALQQVMTGTGAINYGMRFAPGGTQIVTVNQQGGITLWEWETGQPLYQFVTEGIVAFGDVAFSPDGRYFAAPGVMPDTLERFVLVFDRRTGAEAYHFADPDVFHVAFSPDGRYLATAGDLSPTARIWELQTRTLIREITGHTAGTGIVQIAYSPDGRYLATGGVDTITHVWDVQSGEEVSRLVGHSSPIWGLAFSPDGSLVVTGSADQTARVWDVRSGQELRRYVGHTANVESVIFSGDGRRVISVSDDGTVRFWDVDYHDTIAYLCARLQRDLSDAERLQFEITDPQPTCPS